MLCKLDPKYHVQRLAIGIGKELDIGEKSATGIYLLVSNDGIILRGQLSSELSDLYRDGISRYICEGILL